jgi:hypothetical protein
MHFGEFNPGDTIFARTKAFDLYCGAWGLSAAPADPIAVPARLAKPD